MKTVYINDLHDIIDNESCHTTLIPNLRKFEQTNTIHNDIKIYYELRRGSSYVC